jgi:hypothetical protein
MDDSIEEIYNEIVKDPDVFDDLVKSYLNEHPHSSPEEIHLYIIKIAGDKLSQEADSDKKRRQKDIARDRVLSKALNNLPDSGDENATKKQIKSASSDVSNSGTGHERENLADLLIEYSDRGLLRIKKIRETSDDMGRGLNA